MSELLKALQGLPPIKKKIHTVTVQGQSLVVTLEKKLEVMLHGEDAYMWKSPTEIVLKPKPVAKAVYPVLRKSEKGYSFEQGDIHWPNGIIENGDAWLRE
tara:strand:- start:1250 stop:1549 length:300 start_codon:yes stop_codon:yes gene_type:complete